MQFPLVRVQVITFPQAQQGTLAMSLRDGGFASAPKPLWTPEAATRSPISNGEMLATRLN